jgi:hypothetical protein
VIARSSEADSPTAATGGLAFRSHVQPRVLLASTAADDRVAMVAESLGDGGLSEVVLVPIGQASLGATDRCADVVVVYPSREVVEAVSWTFRQLPLFAGPEVVFVLDDSLPSADAPAAQALRVAGLRVLSSAPDGLSWLSNAILPLSEMARARRTLVEASKRLPPAPTADGSMGAAPQLSLFKAEREFRETLIRRAVASTSSLREAAGSVHVPYRTLLHILAKMGWQKANWAHSKRRGQEAPRGKGSRGRASAGPSV